MNIRLPLTSRLGLLLFGLAFIGLTACAGADPSSKLSGPGYADVFAKLREESSSEFVRQVLADDVITQAERDEARALFVSCVNASGTLTATDLGADWEFSGPGASSSEAVHSVIDPCELTTGASVISMYFRVTQGNPQNIDPYELMALCLKKKGVVEPSYSAQDYEHDLEEYMALPPENRPEDITLALSFSDRQRGPQMYNECSILSANEILSLEAR